MKKMGKKAGAVLLAVFMGVSVAGCGGSDYRSADSSAGYTNNSDTVATEEAAADYDSYDDYEYESSDDVYSEKSSAAGGEVTVEEGADTKSNSRKLIRTVDMSVETEHFDELVANVTAKTNALGGYIENSNIWSDNYYGSSGTQQKRKQASFSFRIPKEKMDSFITLVEEGTNVTSKQESMDDVTLTYVDIESHKKALQTEQDRLLELLAQAEDMEVILSIENRLTEIRYQVQSMESQLRTYDNQVDYSTLRLNVTEVVHITPVVEDQSVWSEMSTGFMNSLYSVGRGLTNFFVWIVVHIPQLVIWAIVIFIIVRIIKKLRRRKNNGEPSKRQLRREAKREERRRKKEAKKGIAGGNITPAAEISGEEIKEQADNDENI